MTEGPGPERHRKLLLFITVAAVAIFIALAIAAVLFLVAVGLYLCNFSNTFDNPNIARSPYYEYIVKVRGIENFDAPGGDARIYFPVPLYGRNPVLPFTGRLEKGIGNYAQGYSPYDCTIVDINPFGYHGTRWLEAVNTSHGWMLEARIGDTDYREVDFQRVPKPLASFDKMEVRIQYPVGPIGNKATNATVEGLKVRPLYPDAGDLPANYTRWLPVLPDQNVTNFTSYVYIDEGLRPLSDNCTIDIYASIVIRVDDHPYGMNLNAENYLFMISESIPGNVTGFVPIKVQCLGRLDRSSLSSYMDDFYKK